MQKQQSACKISRIKSRTRGQLYLLQKKLKKNKNPHLPIHIYIFFLKFSFLYNRLPIAVNISSESTFSILILIFHQNGINRKLWGMIEKKKHFHIYKYKFYPRGDQRDLLIIHDRINKIQQLHRQSSMLLDFRFNSRYNNHQHYRILLNLLFLKIHKIK